MANPALLLLLSCWCPSAALIVSHAACHLWFDLVKLSLPIQGKPIARAEPVYLLFPIPD